MQSFSSVSAPNREFVRPLEVWELVPGKIAHVNSS